MTLTEKVYQFEIESSGEGFALTEKEKIFSLTNIEEVKDYYYEDRGWGESKSLTEHLLVLLCSL